MKLNNQNSPIMRYKRLIVSVLFLLFCGLSGVQAQEAVSASGSDATGSGGSAGYTLGQIIYSANTHSSGSAVQGVQQSYQIQSFPTAVGDDLRIDLSASAYPNPTTDYLNLSIIDLDCSDLSYQLFNMQGNLLDNDVISSSVTQIPMSHYSSGPYFLRVIQGNQELKTFKIIKN